MKINYLGCAPVKSGKVEIPEISTTYERVTCAYPDRMPRYCLPSYSGSGKGQDLVAVWQWEPDGHPAGRYGTGDTGMDAVEQAPEDELLRLSREITAALDRRHADPTAYPECADYFASCRAYGVMLRQIDDHYAAIDAYDSATALRLISRRLGRRSTISRTEMADILADVHPPEMQQMSPAQWSHVPQGITFVSLVGGGVRYDQPGSMHPMQMATVSFIPAGMDSDYIRSHAERVVRIKD